MSYDLPGQPLEFSPLGTYDAVDGTHVPKGACSALTNLVHDITTPNTWVPRPAVVAMTGGFPGFLQPQVVSVAKSVGTRIYGMIGTARNSGHDEPFCWNTAIGAFVTISGGTMANTPITQPTTGDWTPPSMDVVGSKIIITHPGYTGVGSNFFGVIDISAPATPAYSSANTGTNPLVAVPSGVVAFNDRAWYVVNNAFVFSKSLDPLTVVNATDVLTLGDSGTPIVAASQQTITQTTGGIIQALTAFKSDTGFWQITGDATTNNLVLNGPNAGVGCASARSAVLTPAGVFAAAVDGIRIVKLDGTLSDKPIPGVRFPFANAAVPSRVCAAYNNTVYRICGTWTTATGNQKLDYWYDFEINQWGGPHSFTYDIAVPLGGYFVLASNDFPGELYSSAVDPSSSSSFNEIQQTPFPGSSIWGAFTWGAGVWGGATISSQPLTYTMTSSILPQNLQVRSIVEATLDAAFTTGIAATMTIQMTNQAGSVLGQASLSAPTGGTIWGAFTWGGAPWAGANTGFNTYNLDWAAPVVYKRAAISITGTAFSGLKIGSFRARVNDEGYLNVQNPP